MHRIFQAFVDRLAESIDAMDLHQAMAEAAGAVDLPCFAYLALSAPPDDKARLISSYPADWTRRYLEGRYERLDPVIRQTLDRSRPFQWGLDAAPCRLSRRQQQLLEEAAAFGIRCGFTIPIHDGRSAVASVTFAADGHPSAFRCNVEAHAEALQLMAFFFHTHARRKLVSQRVVEGVTLSPREFECLQWSARGKSAWEIGRILGISRRTASFHLDNAKTKLGVRTMRQAVARLAAAASTRPD